MKLLITLSLALALLLVSCGGEERTSGVHRIEKDGVALSITLPQGWNADLSQAPPTPETIETLLYAAKAGEGEVSLWYNRNRFSGALPHLGDEKGSRRVRRFPRRAWNEGTGEDADHPGGYPAELFIVPATTGGEAKLTHQVAFFAEDRMWTLNCIEQKGAGLCEGVVSSVN